MTLILCAKVMWCDQHSPTHPLISNAAQLIAAEQQAVEASLLHHC